MLKQYLNNGFLIKKIFNEIEIKEFELSIIDYRLINYFVFPIHY